MTFQIPQPDITPEWAKTLFPSLVNFMETRISEKIKTLEDHVNNSINSANERIDDVTERMGNAEKRIDHLTSRLESAYFFIKRCKDENTELKNRAIGSENYSKRNNLVFTGKGIPVINAETNNGVFHHTDDHSLRIVKKILINNMGIAKETVDAMRITRCHKLPGHNKQKSIIIRFEHFRDRQFVWSKRSSLRKSNIFMSEHFAVETENRRRHLYPIVTKAKSIPKYKDKVSLTVDKLRIDGQVYTPETLYNLPTDLSVLSSCETRTDKMLVIGGSNSEYHPLSNFKQKRYKCYDQSYSSVEQGYAHQKAISHDDHISARNILCTSDPHECKRLGRKVSNFNEETWTVKKNDIMAKLVEESIIQNPEVKSFLMKTDDLYIVEANAKDTHFASGLAFRDPRNLNPSNFNGKNELGEILMALRLRLL